MKIRIKQPAYTATRRSSSPWISRVTAWSSPASWPLEMWGRVAGDELQIDASPGDIVRWGHGNGARGEWGVAQSDGEVRLCDRDDAWIHWNSRAGGKARQSVRLASNASSAREIMEDVYSRAKDLGLPSDEVWGYVLGQCLVFYSGVWPTDAEAARDVDRFMALKSPGGTAAA